MEPEDSICFYRSLLLLQSHHLCMGLNAASLPVCVLQFRYLVLLKLASEFTCLCGQYEQESVIPID